MTEFVQSIDSWPGAVVAIAVVAAFAWCIVTWIKALFR